MSIHDQIGDAKVFGSSTYVQPGFYPMVWIESIKEIKNKDYHDCVVVECDIIESEVPTQPKGTRTTAFANVTKHGQTAAGNVRKWLAQIAGVEPEQVDAAGSRAAMSSDNPFGGTICRIRGTLTHTKDGGDFTRIDFERLSDEIQAKAKELHTVAGF